MAAMIAVENISWSAGVFRLSEISFAIPTGCYAVLMGRTDRESRRWSN